MNILVPITLFGWIPVVLGLFTVLTPRRAVITAVLVGWLFLPIAGYPLAILPDYTKMSATSIGVFLGTLIFDSSRLLSFRPRLIDLPMALWCLCPFASSMANDLGIYDGLAGVLNSTITWGLMYLIGRLYFSDLEGLRELAIGIFIGGLVYVPLCLFESRMSPQLHTWVYGFHQHEFAQTKRWGGWRPTVFMPHGLVVAMWMTAASLIGVWLWFSRALPRLWNVPIWLLVLVQVGTTVVCRSTGALLLLAGGLALLFTTHLSRMKVFMLCAILAPPAYVFARVQGWSATSLLALVEPLGEERSGSLAVRFEAESSIAVKAMQQPLFGWGGWGRNRSRDEDRRGIAVTDSRWIVEIGKRGLVGLAALMAALLVPSWVLVRRIPAGMMASPAIAPAVALVVLVVCNSYDGLLNGAANLVFVVVTGGLSGFVALPESTRIRGPWKVQEAGTFASPVDWRGATR